MRTYINEQGYIQLLRDALAVDVVTPDRTGNGRMKLFGAALVFPDVTKAFPLFTGRPLPINSPFRELMFFLNGRVQTKELEAVGVKFWQTHTSRAFLDSRNLGHLPEGHIGFAYGAVMRHAGGSYDEVFNPVGGFDQLAYVVDTLQKDIWSSRAMIELWAPQDLDRMALTPCCHNYNFSSTMGEDGSPVLNLAIKIRASDLCYGLPANACQFGILLIAMAKLLKVRAGALTLNIVDGHIYCGGGEADQVAFVREIVERELFDLPQVVITKELNTLDDLLSLRMDDFQVLNYKKNTKKMITKRPAVAA